MAPKAVPKWLNQLFGFLVEKGEQRTAPAIHTTQKLVDERYDEFLASLPPPKTSDKPKPDPVASAVARTVKRLREAPEEARAEALQMTREQIGQKMRDPTDRVFGDRIVSSIASGLGVERQQAQAEPTRAAPAPADSTHVRAAVEAQHLACDRLRSVYDVPENDPVFFQIRRLHELATTRG